MNAIMNIFIRTLTLMVFHMLVVVAGKIKLRRKVKYKVYYKTCTNTNQDELLTKINVQICLLQRAAYSIPRDANIDIFVISLRIENYQGALHCDMESLALVNQLVSTMRVADHFVAFLPDDCRFRNALSLTVKHGRSQRLVDLLQFRPNYQSGPL